MTEGEIMRTWPVLALVVASALALILGISDQAAKASKPAATFTASMSER